MTILPLFITRATKHVLHCLREIAYDDMERQASGLIPEKVRTKKRVRNSQPIKLDFAVPKRHRLAWIRRTIQPLPH